MDNSGLSKNEIKDFPPGELGAHSINNEDDGFE